MPRLHAQYCADVRGTARRRACSGSAVGSAGMKFPAPVAGGRFPAPVAGGRYPAPVAGGRYPAPVALAG